MILITILSTLATFTEGGAPGMPGIEAPRTQGSGLLRLQAGRERTLGGRLAVPDSAHPVAESVSEVDHWRFSAAWGLGSWTDLGLEGGYQIERGMLSSRETETSGFTDTWIRLRHQVPLDGIGGLADILVQGSIGLPSGARGSGRWASESFQQPSDGRADEEGSTAQGGAGLSWGADVTTGFDLGTHGIPMATILELGIRGTEAPGRDPQLRAGVGLEGRMGHRATALAGWQWRAPLHRGAGDAWSAVVVGLELRPLTWMAFQLDLRQVLESGAERPWEYRRDVATPAVPMRSEQVAPTVAALRFLVDIRRPSPDADGDGVPDREDRCPTRAEDRDGFLDEDGCPDPDDDADGTCDAWIDDREVHARFAGVCRGRDLCPSRKEDLDGFQDTDGCPEPDNDRDGVCDPGVADRADSTCRGIDLCPLQPEDRDGFQDEDGCRDPDNDGDRIPDSLDACPNGAADTLPGGPDGCPIPPSLELVHAADTAPPVVGVRSWTILFAVGSDEVEPSLDSIAAAVRGVFARFPNATLEIEGHTDIQGEAEANQELSERRARNVLEILARGGIEPSRAKLSGRGFSSPVGLNFDEGGRARNRRVDIRLGDGVP